MNKYEWYCWNSYNSLLVLVISWNNPYCISFSTQEIFLSLKAALEKYHEGIEKATEDCHAKIDEKTAELKKKMFRTHPD